MLDGSLRGGRATARRELALKGPTKPSEPGPSDRIQHAREHFPWGLIEAIDSHDDETEAFLVPDPGQLVFVTSDDKFALDDDPESLRDWQRQRLSAIRKA